MPDDLKAMRDIVGDDVLDYVLVITGFHFINRIADLLDVMFDLPSAGDIARVEVDAGAVRGEHPPRLLSAKQLAKRAAS